MIGKVFLRCARTLFVAGASMACTASLAQYYDPLIQGPLTRDYPGTLTAPARLQYGVDTLTYTLTGSCSGNAVDLHDYSYGPYKYQPVPLVYLGLSSMSATSTRSSPLGSVLSYPGTVPCTNGRYSMQLQLQPDWKQVVPGSYDFVAVVDPARAPLYNTFLQTAPVKVSVSLVPPVSPIPDLWWGGPSESGWGLSIGRNGDALFAAAFFYDYSGKPNWTVMQGGSWDSSHTIWTADAFEPSGTPFDHYDASKLVTGTPRGKASITFTDATHATFQYLAGYSHAVQRYEFAADPTQGPYQGFWWGGETQSGWGLHVAQQGGQTFATWYTYGDDGSRVWLFMPGADTATASRFSGKLYRTSGSSWPTQEHYDGSATKVAPAGTLEVAFDGADTGTMTATVDGMKVVVAIRRFGF